MKKLLITAIAIYFFYYTYNTLNNFIKAYSQRNILKNETQQNSVNIGNPITYKGKKYQYLIFSVKQNEQINIVLNNKEEAAQDIVKNEKCKKAINGGFYDTRNKPIGLLIINEQKIQKSTNNNFLNGYFTTYPNNIFKIENIEPPEGTVNAIQSGPILVQNGNPLNLVINADKQARRSVVMEDINGNIYFAIFFMPNSTYSGPLLSNLPLIVKKMAQKENIEINNSLNLDGGSSSFIKTNKSLISEYKSVMVVICIKE
jgi:uncharacterized protein YigE (DUF2233 family)